jgi:8-oxo-dGTP diphosphatase
MPVAGKPHIYVAAGVLEDKQGRVLITQRPDGSHLAGQWEFPGGKIKAGESELDGLSRELVEELGIRLVSADPLIDFEHDYPERSVSLSVWRVRDYCGTPTGCEDQAVRWISLDQVLTQEGFLQADRPIVEALLRTRNSGGQAANGRENSDGMGDDAHAVNKLF